MSSEPYLSLEMICGDAHAGAPIERCLKSVLERSGGPLVDLIGLTFNGGQEGFTRLCGALRAVNYLGAQAELWSQLKDKPIELCQHCKSGEPPNTPHPVLVLRYAPWPGRFDLARNDGWRHARGEWVLWLDGDDVAVDAGTKAGLAAIERVERDYGLAPLSPDAPTVSLKEFLAQLPGSINVVFSPYDYTMDEHNYVQVRQKMKRVVRRSACHVWHSPEQSGIHEVLTALGGTPEVMAETFGLLIQHYPSEVEVTRVIRNREIVTGLTRPGVLSDPRHAYDVANAALSAGDLATANEAINAAIVHAHNDMDRYTYRLARAYLKMQENSWEGMLQEAFAAVGILPEIRDAYYIACQAFYSMGKWPSVIEWFERGVAKTPTLLSRDQPLAAFTAPRAQAAMAHVYLGNGEKALKLVEEMEAEYPKAGTTVECGVRVREIVKRQRGEKALFEALEFLHSVSPNVAKAAFEATTLTHALDILRSTMPWMALERKIKQSARPSGGLELEGAIIKFPDGGLLTIDDVVAPRVGQTTKVQILSAEVLPEQRSVWVVTRPAPITPNPLRVAFYAPIGITRWMPSEMDTAGMGGSESSVAHLSRELVDIGHEVTVYTNKPTHAITSLWNGVILKDCTQYRPHEWGGDSVVVFCRSPWMARENSPATKRVFCWHQDNGYANPWMWCPDLVKRQRHLFVSEYAAKSLLNDAGLKGDLLTGVGSILGNGISAACARPTLPPAPRVPDSVVWASNPSRGLETLLKAWPLVLEKRPTANLTVMCEWKVMLATAQEEPGFKPPEKLRLLQELLFHSPRTSNLGWLPQPQVLEIFKKSLVYAYPGGPMPEGFGVALVQAQACGCLVVAPRAGALPEVLDDDNTLWLESTDLDEVASTILLALDAAVDAAPAELSRHHWSTVAKRFVALVAHP